MKEPSPRQRELLEFLHSYSRSKGIAPTRVEMGEALRVSKTMAGLHLAELITKGLVERLAGVHRSVRLTLAGHKAIGSQKAA